MKTTSIIIMIICSSIPGIVLSQSNFRIDAYRQFVEANRDLPAAQLMERHKPDRPYYSSIQAGQSQYDYAYLDTVIERLGLRPDELSRLMDNNFVVSERLSQRTFLLALDHIYQLDLPVFVSTDAILQALHRSYDNLLMDLELNLLRPQLQQLLGDLHGAFPALQSRYAGADPLPRALQDVDLYVTIALSLLQDGLVTPQLVDQSEVDAVWNALHSLGSAMLPLFTENPRGIDFSQYKVRGHYTDHPDLGTYFQCMMWLGRIDFALANPPAEWDASRAGLQRTNMAALMLNELLDIAEVRPLLEEINAVITFMVGESDDLTPAELTRLAAAEGISRADNLLDDVTFDSFQFRLMAAPEAAQKIMSMLILGNDLPDSGPVDLPVSFRLMGQRFVIDSYVFASVVFDRIQYQGENIERMMPDPLDVMFALGNDDALPLLNDELIRYPYAAQLATMRYLVDNYDDDFWGASLYNVWLQSLRTLNPADAAVGLPLFMQTSAWHQQKLNTQLASWTQLRHDNLLYAKQSYTGGIGCFFPHSYIEPYPEFYRQIGSFAHMAGAYFQTLLSDTALTNYFADVERIMGRLETLARKELAGERFNPDETMFLQQMLFADPFGCGQTIFSGWYSDLFFTRVFDDKLDGGPVDYLVADVHTQPTDEVGNPVGKVLHVGVGDINLGVFLAESPSWNYAPMAYVGPVMSYYEKITLNFERLTDEDWSDMVQAGDLPARPDWVNGYLVDNEGVAYPAGRTLPGVIYDGLTTVQQPVPARFGIAQNYPNPFNPSTTIVYTLDQPEPAELAVYDITGRIVATLLSRNLAGPGIYQAQWDGRFSNGSPAPSGVYIARLTTPGRTRSVKMLLLK